MAINVMSVIGAGRRLSRRDSAGQLGKKVVFDRDEVGGVCLNWGRIPLCRPPAR